MASRQLTCPSCKFTFTFPARGLPPTLPCPMCRAPIATGAEAAEAPHGFDRPPPFERPASPTAGAARPTRGAPPSAQGTEGGPLGGLRPVGDLLGEAWRRYQGRALPLLALYVIAGVMGIVPLALAAGIGAALAERSGAAAAAAILAGGALALWTGGWGLSAFFLAVKRSDLPVDAALRAGRPGAWAFAWLALLIPFFLVGGTLLFVLPGLLFALWFAFAPFAAVDGERGMGALLRSRALVRGHGAAILLRFVVLAFLGAVVGAVPVVGSLLSLLYSTFWAVAAHALYEELRGPGTGAAPAPPPREKARFLNAAFAGYVLAIGLAVALGGDALRQLEAPGGPLDPARGGTPAEVFRELVDSLARRFGLGVPGVPAPVASPESPPYDFEAGLGTWRGESPEGDTVWSLVVSEPDRVALRSEDGREYLGRARAFFDLGAASGGDGIRVLPGGGVFDLLVDRSNHPGAEGEVMLGTWQLHGGGALRLCLGAPGILQRSSEFRSDSQRLCLAMEREGVAPGPELERGAPTDR